MKSKELKNYNLPDNRVFNESIEAKPTFLLLLLVGIGIVLIIFKYYAYGLTVLLFGLACLLFLPQRRLIEFYDEHMIIYNKARKDECNIIYYDDIKSWEYKVKVSNDVLILTMNDESIQKCDGFSRSLFESYLNKYIKEKKITNEQKNIAKMTK